MPVVIPHFFGEVIVEPHGRIVTLRNLIHAIVRLPDEPFPCVCDNLALYALMTDGRGEHDFSIEMALFDGIENRLLRQSPSRRVNLGQDPTVVSGLPIPLKNVTFDESGQYTFFLLCNGKQIAEEMVVVR
jgi:hypothetical protein